MNSAAIARRLRRDQTDEEKELWRALKAGRFAGFKFRRQHPKGNYYLDFYCPEARLAVELDGFQHGLPEHLQRDQERADPLPVGLAARAPPAFARRRGTALAGLGAALLPSVYARLVRLVPVRFACDPPLARDTNE